MSTDFYVYETQAETDEMEIEELQNELDKELERLIEEGLV